jgi:hypothetical protein
MKYLTIIESPFAGDLGRNHKYLARAIQDSISQGEVPFASHGFYPHFLNDLNLDERRLGMDLGYKFWPFAALIAFYMDYGISSGMEIALERASRPLPDSLFSEVRSLPISFRRIGPNND